MENSSPNPSFSICDIRIQKQMSRVFCQILSPKNSFGKTESALFRHLPEYLEGRTPKEKHPFLFQKKFHPRQIRNARSVFSFGVAEALRGGDGAIHSWSKKVRANAKITPHFKIFRPAGGVRFGASRRKRGFRQELPRVLNSFNLEPPRALRVAH